MNTQPWLDAATHGLLPDIAARLQSEFRQHVAASPLPVADALADLGDPVQLNAQLRQQYPTLDDARDLRAIDQLKISRRLPATGLGSPLQVTGLTTFLMSLLIPLLHVLALQLSWATFTQRHVWLWFLPAVLSLTVWWLSLALGRHQSHELRLMTYQALDTLSALLLMPAIIVALYDFRWMAVLIATAVLCLISLRRLRRTCVFVIKLWNAQLLRVRL